MRGWVVWAAAMSGWHTCQHTGLVESPSQWRSTPLHPCPTQTQCHQHHMWCPGGGGVRGEENAAVSTPTHPHRQLRNCVASIDYCCRPSAMVLPGMETRFELLELSKLFCSVVDCVIHICNLK